MVRSYLLHTSNSSVTCILATYIGQPSDSHIEWHRHYFNLATPIIRVNLDYLPPPPKKRGLGMIQYNVFILTTANIIEQTSILIC